MPPLSLQMNAAYYNMLQLVRIHNSIPERLFQTRASEARLVKYDITLKKQKVLNFFQQNLYDSNVCNKQIKVM